MKKMIIGLFSLIIFLGLIFVLTNQQENLILPSQSPTPIKAEKAQTLDEFLIENKAPENIAKAYRIAYENPQNVLSRVKCYCGCIQNNGHKNNRDCFINEDGSFDEMGLNCGLCVKTAILSKQMLDEGKSVQEISDFVDAKFGKLN